MSFLWFGKKSSPPVQTLLQTVQEHIAQKDRAESLTQVNAVTQVQATQSTQEIQMASFSSILKDIGNAVKRVFTIGEKVAVASEPFVDVAFPGVAPLFNSIVQQVGLAEASAAAAGAQDGTGTQKLALVLTSIEGSIADYEKTAGLTVPLTQTQIEAAANAVVAFLNAIPASTSPAA